MYHRLPLITLDPCQLWAHMIMPIFVSAFLSGNTYNGGATQGVGITYTHVCRRDIGKSDSLSA